MRVLSKGFLAYISKARGAINLFLPHSKGAYPVAAQGFAFVGDKPFFGFAVAPNTENGIQSAFIMAVQAGAWVLRHSGIGCILKVRCHGY